MKTMLLKTQLGMAAAIFAVVTLSQPAAAKDFTAYELAKEGNRYVGEQSKDKVVQIRSEKIRGQSRAGHLVCRLLRSGRTIEGRRSEIRRRSKDGRAPPDSFAGTHHQGRRTTAARKTED
jgi:hypothetical protein